MRTAPEDISTVPEYHTYTSKKWVSTKIRFHSWRASLFWRDAFNVLRLFFFICRPMLIEVFTVYNITSSTRKTIRCRTSSEEYSHNVHFVFRERYLYPLGWSRGWKNAANHHVSWPQLCTVPPSLVGFYDASRVLTYCLPAPNGATPFCLSNAWVISDYTFQNLFTVPFSSHLPPLVACCSLCY